MYLLTHPLEEPHPVVADCALQQPPGAPAAAAAAASAPTPGLAATPGLSALTGGGFGGGYGGGEGVALSGWTNESIVWTSEHLPFVATYNDVSSSLGCLHVPACSTPPLLLLHCCCCHGCCLLKPTRLTTKQTQAHGRLAIWRLDAAPTGGPRTVGSQYELPVVSPGGLGGPRTPANAGIVPAFSFGGRTPMTASSFAGTSYAPSTIKRCAGIGVPAFADELNVQSFSQHQTPLSGRSGWLLTAPI